MTERTETTVAPPVIHLWEPTTTCAMCHAQTRLGLSVPWFCGPVHVKVGERVPGWDGEDDAIAGGMPVCPICHDQHCQEQAA